VSELAEFLQSRGGRLALKIAGVVVVLALAGTAGWLWLRAEETRGQVALAGAAEAVQQGEGPLATAEGRQKAIGLLQAVLAQHSRSAAATQAAYQLGNLQYQAGDYAAARAAYEIALAKGASGSLRTLSASGVGYTWEAQQNYANAVTAYDAAARGLGPKQFFFEEALLDLARAQALAGKPADARVTYERVLKDAPESRRAEDIRGRIAGLDPAAK
jgi:tetratricopeptide (TPR) repeat protein